MDIVIDAIMILIMLVGSAYFGYYIGNLRRQRIIEMLLEQNEELQTIFDSKEKQCIETEYEVEQLRNELEECKVKIKTDESANAVSNSITKDVPDDLTKIVGIGPKIKTLLNQAGIKTYNQLSKLNHDSLVKLLLSEGGSYFKMFDSTTWLEQAKLAAQGKWDELKVLQKGLNSKIR